jgi:hypothetical protein
MDLPVLRRRPSPVAPTLCLAITLALAAGSSGIAWADSHTGSSKAHRTSAKSAKKSTSKSKKASTPKTAPAKALKPAPEDDRSQLVAEADAGKPAARSETAPPATETPAPAFAAEQGTPMPPAEEAAASEPEPTAEEVASDDLGRRKAAQRLLRLGVSLDWRKATLAELKQTERDLLRAGSDGDARVRIIVAARLREEGVNVDWRRLTSEQLVKMYVAVAKAPVTDDLYAESVPVESAPAPTYADGYADGQVAYAQQQQQAAYEQEPVYAQEPVYVSSGPVVIVTGNACPPGHISGGRPGHEHNGGNGQTCPPSSPRGNPGMITITPTPPSRPAPPQTTIMAGIGNFPIGAGPRPTTPPLNRPLLPGVGPVALAGGPTPTFSPRAMPGPVPIAAQPTNLSSAPRQAPAVVIRPAAPTAPAPGVRIVNGQRTQ